MSPTLEIRTLLAWIIIRLSSYVIVGFKNRELCHSATYCSITRLFPIFYEADFHGKRLFPLSNVLIMILLHGMHSVCQPTPSPSPCLIICQLNMVFLHTIY